MTSFADLGVADDLAQVLAARGATEPFPIQAATLPDAIAGRDVCGKAPTGSGKTLAFGVAAVMGVARYGKVKKRYPTGLILVPTRELATQVCNEIRPLTDEWNMRVAPVFGGTGFGKQLDAIQRGLDIMVATPGRLEDLISRGDVFLDNVRVLVLDEADRMADMGFLTAVKRIADQTHPERQTLLFSATLDGDVNVLIKRYQNNPATHEVEVPEEDRGEVVHHFWSVTKDARVEATARLTAKNWPAIVFVRTRHGADRVAKQMSRLGVDAVPIHGNRSQAQRERALDAFSSGKAAVLVATDVAARGIHVDNVALVVHFDLPALDKDYIHRSGRTGRAGNDGTVVSMVMPDKLKDCKKLQRDLRMPRGTDEIDRSMLIEVLEPKKNADHGGGGQNKSGKKNQGQKNRGGNGQGRNRSGNGQGRNRNGGGGGGGKRSNHNKPGQKSNSKPYGNRSQRDGQGRDSWDGDERDEERSGERSNDRRRTNDRSKSPQGRKPAKPNKNRGPRNDRDDDRDGQPRKKKRKPKNRARASQAGAPKNRNSRGRNNGSGNNGSGNNRNGAKNRSRSNAGTSRSR